MVTFKGWNCKNVGKKNLGYDLLFTNTTSGEEQHVEVKGTSMNEQNFFITKNEYAYAEKLSENDRGARQKQDGSWRPLWRLAIVHDALNTAVVSIYTFSEMKKLFEISPIAWRGILKGAD